MLWSCGMLSPQLVQQIAMVVNRDIGTVNARNKALFASTNDNFECFKDLGDMAGIGDSWRYANNCRP